MKHTLLVLFALSLPSSLAAQPRPLAATTLQTTNTGVKSICVGTSSLSGSSTCLGGLQAGPVIVNEALTVPAFIPGVTTNKLYSSAGTLFWNGAAVAVGGAVGPGTVNTIALFSGVNSVGNSILTQAGTTITLAGLLTATGFGTHTFSAGGAGSNAIKVRNTTAGAANFGWLAVGNDADANLASLQAFSSTYTPAGPQLANGVALSAAGVGGLSLDANQAAGAIRFYTGGVTTPRASYAANGNYSLGANLTDSVTVPTIASGFGAGATIAGKASFFTVTVGTGATTGGVVNFNTTFATAPACVVSNGNTGGTNNQVFDVVTTTTTVTLAGALDIFDGSTLHVICRGY